MKVIFSHLFSACLNLAVENDLIVELQGDKKKIKTIHKRELR